jgi:F-type H+-transporting ATPase subunit b
MLDINPGLILWTIITFVIVLGILRFTAWKPLLAALTAREEKIRASLEQAEHAQREAERLLAENTLQMQRAEEAAQRVIREGREMGERLRMEIMEKANSSARHMVEQAKDEIRREKDAALVELRTEVSDLAIGVAAKILDANLDTPAQRRLADAAIADLQKGPNA